jgi:hypothetical protein
MMLTTPLVIDSIYFNIMDNNRIKAIEEEIADLKARWPAHSVPPKMWQQLEELEDKLEQAKAGINDRK